MIQLPDNFDVATLLGDFFNLAAPFVGVSVLVAAGVLILNILRRL